MKRLARRFIQFVSVCVLLVAVSTSALALDEHLDPAYFTDISFDIPDNWEYSSEDIGDTRVEYLYACGAESLFIYSTHYSDEYDETAAYLYDTMVGLIASTFKDNDNYLLLNSEDYEINGCLAQNSEFMCDMNNALYHFKNTSINTGYEIVDFVYARYLSGTDTPGRDTYDEMISNIQIGDSDSPVSSANGNDSNTLTKYESGMYKVGEDIPAGEYVVFADDSGKGYFCVSSDSNQSDIEFNDNFAYNSIITINDGEYVKLNRCYAVPISEDPEVDVTGSGMFLVGTYIPAGEYKLDSGSEKGYYCIYTNSRQDTIVANDNFEGQNYVTVTDGQYLVLSRCAFTDPPERPVKTYTDTETVKSVQEALNAAGYDCGTPDGIAGSGTTAAIEKYQTDNNLSVTGTITDELLNSLGV